MVSKYAAGMLGYGFVRGIYYTDLLKSRDHERMLFGTRLWYIIMCTGMAPIFAPYYAICDMDHIDEMYVLKKKKVGGGIDTFPFPGFRIEKDKKKGE